MMQVCDILPNITDILLTQRSLWWHSELIYLDLHDY